VYYPSPAGRASCSHQRVTTQVSANVRSVSLSLRSFPMAMGPWPSPSCPARRTAARIYSIARRRCRCSNRSASRKYRQFGRTRPTVLVGAAGGIPRAVGLSLSVSDGCCQRSGSGRRYLARLQGVAYFRSHHPQRRDLFDQGTPFVQEIADTLKIIADPARLQILKELTHAKTAKSVSVCDLARRLKISQPNVSHHLRVLKTAGLISCEKDQRFCYYSVNLSKIEDLLERVLAQITPP
jgi:ArsR family transcriptional regulator, arsenate/arsenite/antimonite-responsive transcriptional repressor